MRGSMLIASTLSLLISLAACNPKDNSTAANAHTPNVKTASYQDISQLPLNQGLPLKYSRLQLLCQETPSYVVWPKEAHSEVGVINSLGPKKVVWDLLQTPQEKMTFNLGQKFPSMDYGYQIDITVKIVAGTSRVKPQEGTYLFLTNGINLVGMIKGHLDYLDANGRIMFASSTYTSDSEIIASEGLHLPIIDSSLKLNNSPLTTGLKIECALEAELNPAFESDSQTRPE